MYLISSVQHLCFYTYKENTFLNRIFLILSYEIINAKLLNNKLYRIKNSTKIIDCDDFLHCVHLYFVLN